MAESRITQQEIYQGVYPTVFKKIDKTDVTVNPFRAYKSWTVLSSSSSGSLLPLNGIYSDPVYLPALGSELTFNDLKNVDGSLQVVTYFSINHLFYKYKDQPSKTYGATNLNKTNHLFFK